MLCLSFSCVSWDFFRMLQHIFFEYWESISTSLQLRLIRSTLYAKVFNCSSWSDMLVQPIFDVTFFYGRIDIEWILCCCNSWFVILGHIFGMLHETIQCVSLADFLYRMLWFLKFHGLNVKQNMILQWLFSLESVTYVRVMFFNWFISPMLHNTFFNITCTLFHLCCEFCF